MQQRQPEKPLSSYKASQKNYIIHVSKHIHQNIIMHLIIYASAPEWNKSTLPAELFAGQRVPEHTWARYTLQEGSLKIRELSVQNDISAEHELTLDNAILELAPNSEYQLVQASDDMRVQLDYLTDRAHYIQLRYGMTATHSEVIRAIEQHHIPPSKTLDMGAGQGRNALYLAMQGFDVTAVDTNPSGLANIAQIAAEEQIPAQTQLYDINQAALQENYGFIVSTVTFMFLERDRVPHIIADMQAHTESGGYNLIVCAMDTADYPCPMPFSFTFNENELRDYYAGWELLEYREELGAMHAKDANDNPVQFKFVNMLARKP